MSGSVLDLTMINSISYNLVLAPRLSNVELGITNFTQPLFGH